MGKGGWTKKRGVENLSKTEREEKRKKKKANFSTCRRTRRRGECTGIGKSVVRGSNQMAGTRKLKAGGRGELETKKKKTIRGTRKNDGNSGRRSG